MAPDGTILKAKWSLDVTNTVYMLPTSFIYVTNIINICYIVQLIISKYKHVESKVGNILTSIPRCIERIFVESDAKLRWFNGMSVLSANVW